MGAGRIVAAVADRGYILIFTEHGTILRMSFDLHTGQYTYEKIMQLEEHP